MRIKDYDDARAAVESNPRCRKRGSRRIQNHTYMHRRPQPDGTDAYAVRLHYTDVVTYYADGRVKLDTGGWWTPTTFDRIRSYSPAALGKRSVRDYSETHTRFDGSKYRQTYYREEHHLYLGGEDYAVTGDSVMLRRLKTHGGYAPDAADAVPYVAPLRRGVVPIATAQMIAACVAVAAYPEDVAREYGVCFVHALRTTTFAPRRDLLPTDRSIEAALATIPATPEHRRCRAAVQAAFKRHIARRFAGEVESPKVERCTGCGFPKHAGPHPPCPYGEEESCDGHFHPAPSPERGAEET